jgi:acyl-CoA synthetase (AMP-forming)/AMP-acid ligase II
MARCDEDGFFELVDRKDNLIITGGEHVYPSEVEKVICTHPGILDVAVVGLPHEKWGDAVTAFIIPKDPDSPPTKEEIINLCRSQLAGYKLPKAVYPISQDEMPRTGSGKVLHRLLRERHGNPSRG